MKVLLATAAAVFLAFPAYAIPKCATQQEMAKALEKEYGETLFARGVDIGQRLTEFYSNPKTGTWTVVLTPIGQPSCIVSDGGYFEAVAQGERV